MEKTLNTKIILSTLLPIILMIFIFPSIGVPYNFLFENNNSVLSYSLASLLASLLIGSFIPLIERNKKLEFHIFLISIISCGILYCLGIFSNNEVFYSFFNPFIVIGVGTCLMKGYYKESIIAFILGFGYYSFNFSLITAPFLLIPAFLIAWLILCGYRFRKVSTIGFALSTFLFHMNIGLYVLLFEINDYFAFVHSENLIVASFFILLEVLLWYYILNRLINSFFMGNKLNKGYNYYTLYIPVLYIIPLIYFLISVKKEKKKN
ncbi:hypothetical protein [Anaerophaga thermohalophila]|uniref:hypothetical protein n=1 Tax=Anaerophaga thermohalophila TaxID=177400 RepID=UPI00031592C9|nr:hypothetical protein [Anaerophaga thermohalophila]